MKLFKTLFGLPDEVSKDGQEPVSWVYLENIADLNRIDEGRKSKPQVVFKHSTSCGLSGMMLRRFEKQWAASGDLADFYFLDLIRYRELSREIAQRYGVMHQSPQVLVLDKDGVFKHVSHGDIGMLSPDDLQQNPA